MTPHFSIEELTISEEAKRRGISNTPDSVTRARLQVTALGLECIRRLAGASLDRPEGAALTVHSAYRSPAVNRAVGGTETSDHLSGWAADITCDGLTPLALARLIAESCIPFDQLILEGSRGVVHVSFDPQLRRRVQSQPGGAGTPLHSGLRMA